MTSREADVYQTLGFLTVVEDAKQGIFGGYLVLNRAGRPLEFHCTAPVKANRAQEILYGRTLRPYLYGEQIGRTLLDQVKKSPEVILTDHEAMLAAAEHVSTPIALLQRRDDGGNADTSEAAPGQRVWRIDGPESSHSHLRYLDLGPHRVALEAQSAATEKIADRLQTLSGTLDLAEPFERIRAAIDEARRGGQ